MTQLPIGPRDGNLVLTSTYINQDGFAQFNITAGIYLINVDKPYTSYFNVVSHLRTGWAETLELKSKFEPSIRPPGHTSMGPFAGLSTNNAIGIQLVLLFHGIMFATAALILKFATRRKHIDLIGPTAGPSEV